MTQPTGVEHGDEAGDEAGRPAPGTAAADSRRSGVAPDSGTTRSSRPDEHGSEEEHESHGHSTAAWTAVGIILAGSIIMSLAVVFPSVLWFVVGAVVVVVGGITGKVLSMAGYGDKAGSYQAAHRGAGLPGRQQHDSGTQ